MLRIGVFNLTSDRSSQMEPVIIKASSDPSKDCFKKKNAQQVERLSDRDNNDQQS